MMRQNFWRIENKMVDKKTEEKLDQEIKSALIIMIKNEEESGRPAQRVITIDKKLPFFGSLKPLGNNGIAYPLSQMGHCYISREYKGEIAVFYFIDKEPVNRTGI